MSENDAFTRMAEVYEKFYVPALLEEWAKRVAEAAAVRSGQHVLDVACGTGIVARTIAKRLSPHGSVIGVDPNRGMLAVARRHFPEIEWHEGRAEALPFEANRFDAVVSQFGLMFFSDRVRAIQEMMRVLRPGGQMVVAVWDAVEKFPIYSELSRLLQRHYGNEVIEEFLAPHSLGSPELLRAVFTEAGVASPNVAREEGTARFPSLREWLWIEVKEWLLGDRMDDGEFEELLAEAQELLRPFVTAEGTVISPAPGYIVTATSRLGR